jgi:hypothetical protein
MVPWTSTVCPFSAVRRVAPVARNLKVTPVNSAVPSMMTSRL